MSSPTYDLAAVYVRTDDLTADERHRVLASARRRTVIDVLVDRSGPVGLAELALAVAAREDAVDATDATEVERVRWGLHHRHLPLLADVGLLAYEVETRTVFPTAMAP